MTSVCRIARNPLISSPGLVSVCSYIPDVPSSYIKSCGTLDVVSSGLRADQGLPESGMSAGARPRSGGTAGSGVPVEADGGAPPRAIPKKMAALHGYGLGVGCLQVSGRLGAFLPNYKRHGTRERERASPHWAEY